MGFNAALNVSMVLFLITSVLMTATVRTEKKILLNTGYVLYAAALFFSVLSFGLRWSQAQRIPVSNTYETLVFFAMLTGMSYIFFIKSSASRMIGAGLAIMTAVIIAAAALVDDSVKPLVPALKSNWLAIHVMLCFISYSAFAAAFVASCIVLFGKPKQEAEMDKFIYKSIITGFPFLTLGILTGAVWAERAWGTYWSWDPKETWALITWLVYAAFLHLRFTKGFSGKRGAWIAFAAFFFVIFTYFGVNYLLPSLHSYK